MADAPWSPPTPPGVNDLLGWQVTPAEADGSVGLTLTTKYATVWYKLSGDMAPRLARGLQMESPADG
jgi:hypothetical protein